MSLPARLRATWSGFPGPVRWGAIALAALVALWVLSGWLFGGEEVSYRTATATRGTIEQTVTALGSLQPKEYVNVGAQVSGQLKKVYVEVGDEVKEGDLLAEIDAKVYETEVAGSGRGSPTSHRSLRARRPNSCWRGGNTTGTSSLRRSMR